LVAFIAPRNVNKLYLGISLAGIFNRSLSGDMLMVGRTEFPKEEVIKFTTANFNAYREHPSAYLIDTFVNDPSMEILAADPIENSVLLNSLRLPLDNVANQIVGIITGIVAGDRSKLLRNPEALFIGLAVTPEAHLLLCNFTNAHVSNGQVYNHHLTLTFFGGVVDNVEECISPGEYCQVEISDLVIRRKDSASAFRVSRVFVRGVEVYVPGAHITARIPFHEKPQVSKYFVDLNNDTVEVIPYSVTVEAVSYWAGMS
jgi:hypothetical protein